MSDPLTCPHCGAIDRVIALEQRAERLERALRTLASQEEPAGELCWCSEGEALNTMAPADHATACIRAREALGPAKETT